MNSGTTSLHGMRCTAGDKCIGDGVSGCAMYRDAGCKDDMIKPSDVYGHFPCLETGGQSGAPIWLYNKAASKRTIVGVDSSGSADNGEDFTLVTDAVVKELAAAAADF